MGKISPVSGKYIIHANIQIDGVVEKPDVIGAVFGQTEGLLGSDLELRELQRSGRIGRIEVNTDVKSGKVSGIITIPSSLDKAETAIIAAAMEVIERIGPCNAKVRIEKIEDVRISKRTHVINRAKELLRGLMDDVMPDSLEIAEEVSASVRVMEAIEYGPDKLPAGPTVTESEEVIVVEGRADVMNLLKYGFKNVICMNGSNIPQTIIDLSKEKTVTLFADGDRGGDLIIKQFVEVAEADFVIRAPDGKEVEELTQKEIHKALRGKVTPEQAIADMGSRSQNNNRNRYDNRRDNRNDSRNDRRNDNRRNDSRNDNRNDSRNDRPRTDNRVKKQEITDYEKEAFATSVDELLGTKGAALLDDNANVLGKVPLSELESTLKSLKGSVHAVVLDGDADSKVVKSAEESYVKFVVGMKKSADSTRLTVVSADDLKQ